MGSADIRKSNYFPKCWDDDIRMNSLMLEFRPRNVNPFGYEEKMSFWIESIKDWCKATKSIIFTHADVCKAFERKRRQPECLQTVIDEMRKQKILVTMEQFSSGERGWIGWTFDVLVKKPVSWSWTAALNLMNWKSEPQKYINVAVLKDIASDIMALHYREISCEWTDHIVVFEDLFKQCKDICDNKQTFQLVIEYLEREKQVQVFEVDKRKVVKFRRKDEPTVGTTTELDIELQRLQYAKDVLDKEIEKLDSEMESLRIEAKQVLVKGQKDKASLLVKKKKRLEVVQKKKLAAYDNLENLFSSLHQSKSEKAVLQAYQSGVLAFRRLHTEEDFSLDKADTTMAEIEEVLEDHAAIETAISQPIGFDADVNLGDSDLELELEEIMQKQPENVIERPENTKNVDKLSKIDICNEEPSRIAENSNQDRREAAMI